MRLRPLTTRDAPTWDRVREQNRLWLSPWEASLPASESTYSPTTLRQLARRLVRAARRGEALPFVIEVDGEFAGQVTVSNVVRGSAQFGSIGYWLDQRHAGRGVVPLAVAMVIDHCFSTVGLHRIEIAIRPENSNSLRVVEKLGMREIGLAPRFLHIDGAWRDHRLFAVTVEECPVSMVDRLLQSHE
ncbi:GNAT family N-acetyltransferase [Nocardioides limicola]|uniref:GNAT family N-acetyltransferase n=1 Tax=Nocardioides limicola TaxID=2803368 RepID=UPI0027DAE7F4|nr:GNAT family protein [Nocardioides sp. DJM-14]